jgi:hypothetical protein
MFLGLLDPNLESFSSDPDSPYVFGPPGSKSGIISSDPDPSINEKKFFKNLDFCCLVLFS